MEKVRETLRGLPWRRWLPAALAVFVLICAVQTLQALRACRDGQK